jgi:hypothetical protein
MGVMHESVDHLRLRPAQPSDHRHHCQLHPDAASEITSVTPTDESATD